MLIFSPNYKKTSINNFFSNYKKIRLVLIIFSQCLSYINGIQRNGCESKCFHPRCVWVCVCVCVCDGMVMQPYTLSHYSGNVSYTQPHTHTLVR